MPITPRKSEGHGGDAMECGRRWVSCGNQGGRRQNHWSPNCLYASLVYPLEQKGSQVREVGNIIDGT
jgi:hypothetical protein